MPIRYTCPTCEHIVELDESELIVDNIFSCEECGAEYMITTAKPFACEPLDHVEEDDDDDDDIDGDDEDDEVK